MKTRTLLLVLLGSSLACPFGGDVVSRDGTNTCPPSQMDGVTCREVDDCIQQCHAGTGGSGPSCESDCMNRGSTFARVAYKEMADCIHTKRCDWCCDSETEACRQVKFLPGNCSTLFYCAALPDCPSCLQYLDDQNRETYEAIAACNARNYCHSDVTCVDKVCEPEERACTLQTSRATLWDDTGGASGTGGAGGTGGI